MNKEGIEQEITVTLPGVRPHGKRIDCRIPRGNELRPPQPFKTSSYFRSPFSISEWSSPWYSYIFNWNHWRIYTTCWKMVSSMSTSQLALLRLQIPVIVVDQTAWNFSDSVHRCRYWNLLAPHLYTLTHDGLSPFLLFLTWQAKTSFSMRNTTLSSTTFLASVILTTSHNRPDKTCAIVGLGGRRDTGSIWYISGFQDEVAELGNRHPVEREVLCRQTLISTYLFLGKEFFLFVPRTCRVCQK